MKVTLEATDSNFKKKWKPKPKHGFGRGPFKGKFGKGKDYFPPFHTANYRADWELAASSRRGPGGVLGCPVVLWGLSAPNLTRIYGKPLFWKIGRFFLCACGYVVDWPHVAQARALLATKTASFGKKDMPLGNPPRHGTRNCTLS